MRCPRCRSTELPAAARTCERCGYSLGLPVAEPDLPAALDQSARTELAGLFELGAVVECDEVSVRYLAEDPTAHRWITLRAFDLTALRQAGLAPAVQNAIAAAGTLNHPHVVPVYRSGITARVLWCAMHRPDGRSLAATLAYGGPLDLATCLGLVEQVSSALHYAHRRGVVHGDVTTANIEMADNGWALVTDFAVDRLLRHLPGGMRHRAAVGVAPEEHVTPRVSPAADQYALAVTICECLTGPWPPDDDPSSGLTARDRLSQRVAEARRDVPSPARAALRRALSPNPADRFRTILEFAAALDVSAEPAPPPPMRPPADVAQEESQRVVFVSGGRPARGVMRTATRVALLVGVSGLGVARLFRADPGLPRLAPAVVMATVPSPSTPSPAEPVAPPALASAGTVDGFADTPLDTLALSDDSVTPPDESRDPPAPAAERRVAAAPRPRATPRREEPAPRTFRPPPPVVPGRLYVSSRPWGQLYVDGRLVGNTPASGVSIAPGAHRLRITRDGFAPWDRDIVVDPDGEVRLIDIQLRRIPP